MASSGKAFSMLCSSSWCCLLACSISGFCDEGADDRGASGEVTCAFVKEVEEALREADIDRVRHL
jgi:hypothetical protein